MYIKPTDNQAKPVQKRPKRLKGGEDTSFAEQVESLLELDAVEITTSPKPDQDKKKQQKPKKEQDEKETPNNSSSSAKSDSGLNITA